MNIVSLYIEMARYTALGYFNNDDAFMQIGLLLRIETLRYTGLLFYVGSVASVGFIALNDTLDSVGLIQHLGTLWLVWFTYHG